MKKRNLVLFALTSTMCLTGCFDQYSSELTAEEAKNICQAIISNANRPDFDLPEKYGVEMSINYNLNGDKTDAKGKLIYNKEQSFIYLDVDSKEGTETEYTHKTYFLYDNSETNQYIEGISDKTEKKAVFYPKGSYTKEQMFTKVNERIGTTGKDWAVQTSILELLCNSLLLDVFVKGLHIAENIPTKFLPDEVKKYGIEDYKCSLKSDGELSIDIIYDFTIGDIDVDIKASWKDGYLNSGNVHYVNNEDITEAVVSTISTDPFKPDMTGYDNIIMP